MDHLSATTKLPASVYVSNSAGVQALNTHAGIAALTQADKPCWIDIINPSAQDITDLLRLIGLDASETVWMQRFGQAGRLSVGPKQVIAVTWIADRHSPSFGPLIEVHFLTVKNMMVTIWQGDPDCLSEIRQRYHERSLVLEKNMLHAASVLLQLLLSTLDLAMAELDRRIQAVWFDIDRYSSSVRSAIVGVETLPDVIDQAAAQLNDYAGQVEKVERRLQDRSRWLSNIMQDYGTSLAAKQGDQINRLTIVSTIFLPLTWLTGFFGMNFDWLDHHLSGTPAFLGFGIGLPIFSVCATIFWFRQRRLI